MDKKISDNQKRKRVEKSWEDVVNNKDIYLEFLLCGGRVELIMMEDGEIFQNLCGDQSDPRSMTGGLSFEDLKKELKLS